MPTTMDVNLKVLVMDTDFYALHAIISFLAWDRRTRVTESMESLGQMWTYIDRTPLAELPNMVVLCIGHSMSPSLLADTIIRLRRQVEDVHVLILSRFAEPVYVEAAADAGAVGYLLKQDVRLQITHAIVYSLEHDFIVTAGVARACAGVFNHRVFHATVLPEMRRFPELTDRVRQALKLCVLDGMPAQLAADEMGISLHTIRGYIKEGYRILEAYDDTEYPVKMTPQERAFMRLTAFEEDNGASPHTHSQPHEE